MEDTLSYLRAFLKGGVRPDSRPVHGFRRLIIRRGFIGTADGSSFIRMGDTTVCCGIVATIGKPLDSKEELGCFAIEAHISALDSDETAATTRDLCKSLSSTLSRIIEGMRIIDLRDLVVRKGVAVWCLNIDVEILNSGGNLLDACLIGVLSSLVSLQLPAIEYDEPTKTAHVVDGEPTSLPVQLVVPASFCILGEHVLPDPTDREECLADSSVTIIRSVDDVVGKECILAHMTSQRFCVHKPGGAGLDQHILDKCIELSQARTAAVEKELRS